MPIKISQSFLKEYADLKSDFVDKCGLQIKYKYLDKMSSDSSEAMKLGQYFEFMSTGGMPKYGGIPVPKKLNDGSLSKDYKGAVESAKYFNDVIDHYGIEILDVGVDLENDKMTGTADIYAKWNGRHCFIDQKFSGLLENRYDPLGWETQSLPEKHKLMIQGVQYTILAKDCLGHEYEDFDFYYFIFDSKNPKNAKIVQQVIDIDTINLHLNNIDFVYEELNSNPIEKIFKPKPKLSLCNSCVAKDICEHNTKVPLIETVYY